MSEGSNIARQIMMSSISDASDSIAGAPKTKVSLNPIARRIVEATRGKRLSPVLLAGTVHAIETFIVLATAALSYTTYLHGESVSTPLYLTAVAIGTLACFFGFQMVHVYSTQAFRALIKSLARMCAVWVGTFAMLSALAFAFKIGDEYSRGWVVIWFATGLVALIAFRITVKTVVQNLSASHGAGAARRHRGRRRTRRRTHQGAGGIHRYRHRDLRHLRRPRRRPLAPRPGRIPETRHHRRAG